MKQWLLIPFILIILMGCSGNQNGKPGALFEKYNIGESVYICGCPMMCCNSISRSPRGRCACNMPLRQGIVSRIQNGRLYVNVSGREKVFFVAKQ